MSLPPQIRGVCGSLVRRAIFRLRPRSVDRTMQGRRDRLVPRANVRPRTREWLTRIRPSGAIHASIPQKGAPYAVNLILTMPTSARADLEVVLNHSADVRTSLTRHWLVPRGHDYGGIVFPDVIKVRHAEKASKRA